MSEEVEKYGIKEVTDKQYYEFDWDFITQMAEKMSANKKNGKYPLYNWKKPLTPEAMDALKQALFRHVIAVMKGEYADDGREFGHLEAIADNAMMINYQLKEKKC